MPRHAGPFRAWWSGLAGLGVPFGEAARLGPLVVAQPVAVALDLHLLLADLLADLPLLGHGLGVEADALAGNDPLLDHRLLLAQHHLVLGLGDVRAAGGRLQVGVGDRLALEPCLLALDRHRHLLLLGGDIFAQPDTAAFPLGSADGQLLLGAGYGVVGGRPRHIPADSVAILDVPVGVPGGPGGGVVAGLLAAVGGVVIEAIVAPEFLLLGFRQVPIGIHPWRVLDQ